MYNYQPGMPYMAQNRPFENPYLQRQEVIRVNGRNGAEALNLAPNSSVLLLDETASIVWLKVTDGAGYPSLTAYTITPYKEKESVDLNSLESRIAKLEARFNESNITSTEQELNAKAE